MATIVFLLTFVILRVNVYGLSLLQAGIGITPPKFKTPPTWPDSSYYDEYGPPISVSCDLEQGNQATLIWFKDGSILKQNPLVVIENENQTLTFRIPVRNQTGTYECLAYNTAGNTSYSGYIFISERKQDSRPRVVLTDPDSLVKHAAVGDNVTISCTFDVGGSTTGLFDLNMDWHKDRQSVNDTDHTTWGINQTQSNDQVLSLTINFFKATDYGPYECVGTNHKGNDSRIVSIVPPEHTKKKLPVILIIIGGSSTAVVFTALVVTGSMYRRYRRNRKYEPLEWDKPDVGQYDVPKRQIKFDVFVSYSHDDLLWVKDNLFKELTDRQYEVCLDFKDFVPGMATSENIIDAIYCSRKTIVLMSRHFLKSTWGQFELQQAHYRAISQRKDVLILIKLDDCKVPTKLMGKTFLDWTDDKVLPHFWTRLFEALGEPGGYNPDDGLLTGNTREPGIDCPVGLLNNRTRETGGDKTDDDILTETIDQPITTDEHYLDVSMITDSGFVESQSEEDFDIMETITKNNLTNTCTCVDAEKSTDDSLLEKTQTGINDGHKMLHKDHINDLVDLNEAVVCVT